LVVGLQMFLPYGFFVVVARFKKNLDLRE